MFMNSLKIALRNLLRYKAYSFINIMGLAIGMACCILILLWVQNELSFDKYHAHADRIYRLCVDANFGAPLRAALSMAPAAPALQRDFPEVVAASRISHPGSAAVKCGDRLFQEKGVAYADNSIFDIFSFPFISGNPENDLTTAYSVVITRDMASKYFGEEDPVGKTLRIGSRADFTVTGVVENVPHNSHFTFNMLRSMETLYAETRQDMEAWFNIQYFTYLLLGENCDAQQFEEKLPGFVDQYMGEVLEASGGTLQCFLQPLTRIHLHSNLQAEFAGNVDIN